MSKLVRMALIVPTLAILAVTSATVALADNGVSMSVDPNASLTARLEIQLTVTYSCPSGWLSMGGGGVTVEQAVGKAIAHGSNYIPNIQCTGTDQVVAVTVIADPSGPPFKKGPAIVTGNLNVWDYVSGSGGGSATVTMPVKLK